MIVDMVVGNGEKDTYDAIWAGYGGLTEWLSRATIDVGIGPRI